MGSRAFWAVVFGFLLGVFARSFLLIGWSAAVLCMVLGCASFLLSLIMPQRKSSAVFLGVACLAGGLGIARMQFAVLSGDPILTRSVGTSVLIDGTVSQEPDARETSTLVPVRVRDLVRDQERISVGATVLAELPAHARIAYGDEVRLQGTLRLPEPFETDATGRMFEYPEYLAAQGIEYQMRYARVVSITENHANPLKSAAIQAKELFLHGLDTVMPDPEAALAGGITVGDKRSIGPELTSDFQRDSLIHMVVLSGYNITVVLNAVNALLRFAPRSVQFSGSGFVVAFFILMSGGASSATRAGLMALLAVLARATHRVYLGERVLAFVSLAMVAWDPWTLCFDPSFQLSAMATLGLIVFTPLVSRLFSPIPERFGAREILASTCSTQLMVLPLLLYQNGAFSLVALPANLFTLLPIPWAMLFSLIAGIAGCIFGPAATLVALPAYASLWYVISAAHLFAAVPFASITIPSFDPVWVWVAYATVLAVQMGIQRKTAAE